MSFVSKVLTLTSAAFVIYIGIKIYEGCQPPPLPMLDENEYWGPGIPPIKQDTSIKPFKINVPDEVLSDLKHRLEIDRPYTPPLEGIQQQYGFNTNLLTEILEYWKNKYNWREREVFLNQFPQFKTNIQGLDIHYIHVKPKVSSNIKIRPLLILHGWPGSVVEMYRIIPILTAESKSRNFVFEVIAPSLPGFAFSQGSSKRGLSDTRIAVIFKNLMKRIGHDKFYVHGGDLGALIGNNLATLFPKNVLGLHSNMCSVSGLKVVIKLFITSIYPSLFMEEKYVHKIFPLSEKFVDLLQESGYFHIQATKPDTIGVALGQSPSGLAAYFLEKFSTGTNITYREREDAGLKEKFTYNELLDNIMFYWLTNSVTTSFRIYSESFNKRTLAEGIDRILINTEVPCACARFGQEIGYWTDWMLKEKYQNLVYTSDYDEGGHFAAFEVPKLLVNDIFLAVSKMEQIN
ncbi:hypothetical protein RI129_009149 [Pyrocoelia pectoralis]|uniref:Epoxide hydrolase n=1 Tax=Pyrocoelia pectoralis TaxID=417401 RepID=A0AAN7ZI21_9COLE